MEIGTVRQIDIDQEMQGAYLDYAMSVIVARALPDVRDGLKPVHRRILYAMHDMGVSADKPYKKSARIVGEVLGKYHPHGDAAVYEAMARMAQDFSLRYVLVDGQGNFGSIDGDSPAAMRYTEARLAAISEAMLADIDKETVNFLPNFDETLTEPAVLPALLPNLLVNGASGIAVGMTTNVPPHNLSEVVDALVHLIDRYSRLEDVTVEDLTRFIQGPDFPTGGVVYRFGGADGDGDRIDLIRNAYALGRGHLTVQANVHIEEMSRNRSRLVVTELPYQVNKTRLIERIAELVRDGKVEGITDLRDESDRQGMRICIELTRTVEARDVLSQLFRLTPMQTTFSFRMLALVDGEPRLLPLKRVLTLYLEHRQEIITRRSRFLLEKARLRAHILEGLLKALDNIDEVVSIIRRSQTTETARKNLMDRLKLTEIQADAILDMPLKRLVALERRKIADEHKEKLAEIKYLEGLLRDPAKIRGVIREELLTLKGRFGDARRTRIVDREKGHHTARDLVEAQDVLLTLWQDGQVCMTGTAPRISARAAPLAQVWANTRDDVAFFTANGQGALVPLHQLPADDSVPVSNLVPLDSSAALAGMVVLPRLTAEEETVEAYLTLATRLGRIKRVSVADFGAAAGRGAVTAITLDEGDRLAWMARTSGEDEVLLITRQGQAIRFAEAEVRPMGLAAAGVLAVKLAEADAVVGMGVVGPETFVLTFTEQGYAKRTPVQMFPTQKRYGGGVQAVKLGARTGNVAVAGLAGETQDVVLITARGRVARLAVKSIHPMGRASTGYRSPQGSEETYLEPGKHGPPLWLAVLPASPDAGGGSHPAAGKPRSGDAGEPGAAVGKGRSAAPARADADGAGRPRRAQASKPAGSPDKPMAATAESPHTGGRRRKGDGSGGLPAAPGGKAPRSQPAKTPAVKGRNKGGEAAPEPRPATAPAGTARNKPGDKTPPSARSKKPGQGPARPGGRGGIEPPSPIDKPAQMPLPLDSTPSRPARSKRPRSE